MTAIAKPTMAPLREGNAEAMYLRYSLLMYVERLVGGLPKHPDLIRRWQEANWPIESKVPDGLTMDEAVQRTLASLGATQSAEERASGIWTGFASVDGELALENRNVKAMLKESANIVRTMPAFLKNGKSIPLRSRVAERVFVEPHWIPLGRREPDESPERAIHVMTAMGPRTALKRVDVVYDVTLACTLVVLNDGVVTEAILRGILDHAKYNGIGTDRSQGNGTFSYELTQLS